MMITKIMFVACAFCIGVSSAVPENALIERYDRARHEEFVRRLITTDLQANIFNSPGTRLETLNDHEVDLVSDETIQGLEWYKRPIVRLLRWKVGQYQQEIYVATEGEKPVGFIRWHFKPYMSGIIDQIAVAQAYRRKGYGKELLQRVLDNSYWVSVGKVRVAVHPDQRTTPLEMA